MFITIILISLKINLKFIKFKNLTYPVEAFAGDIGMAVETSHVKDCMPEATCVSGAVRTAQQLIAAE